MKRLRTISASTGLALAGLAGHVAIPTAVGAQEVVQSLPDPARDDLNDALRRLSRNPQSVPALIDAGRAALELGDLSAALGFFNRAQAIAPDNGRVLSGLALIATRRGEAVTAIQLFDNAEAAGTSLSGFAGDRGLAYDLVGSNSRAQRLYRQALSREENNEIIRRLALSYAISGDAAASEATLLPLLQRQDRAAFRTRAFALAILGQPDEAMTIAETMLPPRIAGRLAPYLRYMNRLTPAQQALAANLGRFPEVADIGRDSPQVAALANGARAPQGGDRLTPAGEPLGQRPSNAELPPVDVPPSQAFEPTVELPVETPQPPARQPDPVVAAVLADDPDFAAQEQARPSFSISETRSEPVVQEAEQRLDLREAFADFDLADTREAVRPAAGAVDITAIEPARPAPAEPQAPPPPVHPSRHWVQVATGQDISAFRFDWRRLVRNADGLLDGRDAFTAPWNQTNRLVTGPFESQRAANDFVSQLDAAGISAFRFTSAAGEEVRALD